MTRRESIDARLRYMHDTLQIPRRFCGPPDSGNGGFSAGLLANFVAGPAEVTLRRPPPLERALRVETSAEGADLFDGDDLVARAVLATVDLDPPAPVGLGAAVAAAAECPTLVHPEWHAFPTCFVCGHERTPGDGLRVFPGRVENSEIFAAPVSFPSDLIADGVPDELMWAALDCPSAYVMYMDGMRPDHPYVLGRLAARLDAKPEPGSTAIAISWQTGEQGRKLFSGSALFAADGDLLAVARATWIALVS
jgi:hypothetical protein